MFDFDCVIEEGTYDDFKECVFAIVHLPKPVVLRIQSTPITGDRRRMGGTWTVEMANDLVAFYNVRAEAAIVDALRNAAAADEQVLGRVVRGRGRRR